MLKILAISGSLSRSSSNTALLRAASCIGRKQTAIEVYERMSGLPLFNVDLDIDPAPESVVDFRARLASSDGILISSPEYAHGISGVLKNALDWTVSSGELRKACGGVQRFAEGNACASVSDRNSEDDGVQD